MAVLNALRKVPGALARNPILVALLGFVGLLQAPQTLAQYLNSTVSIVISLIFTLVYLFGVPFFQGGMIGMADEALRNRTRLGTFVQAGKENYVSLLVAYLAMTGVVLVLMLVVFAAVFAGIFSIGTGSQNGLVVAVGVVLVVGLVYLVFAFFIQFYSHEIVLNDAGAVSGIKGSVGLVRRNLLSTTGYFLLTIAGSLAVVVAVVAAQFLLLPQSAPGTMPAQPPLTSALGQVVVSTVVTAVVGSLFAVYSVAFYEEIRDHRNSPEQATTL
ncbi:hypothetical protein [Haloprofundus halobius]|uniref:DUF7847 domain-containing protein n=1 Tax=Haloprofundus halobius TaxID=2876194 RepID=UPI001CCC415D|nr:hypothetical protein [Haloprofundus halobius]